MKAQARQEARAAYEARLERELAYFLQRGGQVKQLPPMVALAPANVMPHDGAPVAVDWEAVEVHGDGTL